MRQNRLAKGEIERFTEPNVIFHLAIIRSSHNPLLIGIYKALTGCLTDQRKQVLLIDGAEQGAVDSHERVFEALASRDKDQDEHEMAKHMDSVITAYWTGLSKMSKQGESPSLSFWATCTPAKLSAGLPYEEPQCLIKTSSDQHADAGRLSRAGTSGSGHQRHHRLVLLG